MTCQSLRIGKRETCGAPALYERIGGFTEGYPNALCDLCLKRIYRGFEIRIADFWKPITIQPAAPTKLTSATPLSPPPSTPTKIEQLTLI